MKTFYLLLTTALIFAFNGELFPQGTAINSTGAPADNSAILDISSTSKGILISRMTEADKIAISSPATGLMIYQTDDTTGFWYFNGISWVQAVGITGATGQTGQTGSQGLQGTQGPTGATGSANGTGLHIIGEYFNGGQIFYLESNELHGFICTTTDLKTSWGCEGTLISGADGQAIGTGQQNTLDIIAGCSTPGIAARLCDNLVLAGYSDWYLPSLNEVMEIYKQRFSLSTDNVGWYATSSEYNASYCWSVDFSTGSSTSGTLKSNPNRFVRCVRNF